MVRTGDSHSPNRGSIPLTAAILVVLIMKKILCYGDSNTFGFNPQTGRRFDKKSRWSGILSFLLAGKYEIIEEGMNNRTGFFRNPEGLIQSGCQYLSVYLQSNHDFNICVLSLGTNDSQIGYPLDEKNVEKGLKNLIYVLRSIIPGVKIIIVPPVKITKDVLHSNFSTMFNEESIAKIQKTFHFFKKFAKDNSCFYFDFNNYVLPSKYDGIHYSIDSHKIIAENLAKFILKEL